MKLLFLVCLVPVFGFCAMTGSPMTNTMDSEGMGDDSPMTAMMMDSEEAGVDGKGDVAAIQTELESSIEGELMKEMVGTDNVMGQDNMGSDDKEAAETSQEEEEMAVEQSLGLYRRITGALIHVTASVNHLWGVNHLNHIFRCNRPCRGRWVRIPGALNQIDASDHEVWGVNRLGVIFKRPVDGSGGWQSVSGRLKHVSASGNGYIWGVNAADQIFRCQKPCNGRWHTVDGRLKQIDGGQSYVYGVNSANQVFVRPVDGSGSWRHIPGRRLKHVTASADSSIYGVDTEDRIYSCPKPCFCGCFQQLNGRLSQVDGTFNTFAGVNAARSIFIRPIITP